MVLTGLKIWHKIQANNNLEALEKAGLARGDEKGKRPDVPIETIHNSLKKQFFDFEIEYRKYEGNTLKLKQTLADLRNVVGIMFLSLDGERFAESKTP